MKNIPFVLWKRRLLSVVGGAFFIAGVATPTQATSLSEALAMSYRTNPDLQAARRALGAVNEGVPQALAGWRPNVNVQASAGQQRVDQQDSTFSEEETTTPLSGRFEVEQPLYRGGRTSASTQRAVSNVGAERARLLDTEQDVLLRTVRAYMDVWRDQAILRLNKSNVEVLRRQLEATQDRFDVGEVTRTDVSQAESRLSRAIADRVAARGQLQASRAAYQEVVGRPPEKLADPKPPTTLPANLDKVIEIARSQNPQVRAARFSELAARKNVRAVSGELLPEASLLGRASKSANQSSSDSEREVFELLAQVTIPLYQSGAVYSRVREAKQTANQRRLELRSARRTVEQEAVNAWEDLKAAQAQIQAFQDQVESAEIALEGVRQENQVGARTVLDVLDAEQELLNAQVDLVRAQRDEIVANYTVLFSLGRLTADARDLPVEVFNVEDAFKKVRDKIWGRNLPSVYDDQSASSNE